MEEEEEEEEGGGGLNKEHPWRVLKFYTACFSHMNWLSKTHLHGVMNYVATAKRREGNSVRVMN
ncbi:hypothetical protein Hdeb2414_s0006g00193701 [Helianthus debilis subsp. tardiflorus]